MFKNKTLNKYIQVKASQIGINEEYIVIINDITRIKEIEEI